MLIYVARVLNKMWKETSKENYSKIWRDSDRTFLCVQNSNAVWLQSDHDMTTYGAIQQYNKSV